jgi:hypothetical protein
MYDLLQLFRYQLIIFSKISSSNFIFCSSVKIIEKFNTKVQSVFDKISDYYPVSNFIGK